MSRSAIAGSDGSLVFFKKLPKSLPECAIFQNCFSLSPGLENCKLPISGMKWAITTDRAPTCFFFIFNPYQSF